MVPLRGATQLLGAVEAHDRLSRWRGFGKADIQLLRTLASAPRDRRRQPRLLARLRHDAYHDPLTGLLNRRASARLRPNRCASPLRGVVLRIDLDILSTVSDALGQAWGNRMVVAAGRRLRDELGPEVPSPAWRVARSPRASTTKCDHAQETAERSARAFRPYPSTG